LPAICIDARHAKAALDMAANKTDANDADGLAHLAEVGFFREVRVKGFDSMLTRTLWRHAPGWSGSRPNSQTRSEGS
jgi:transposase